MSEERTRILKMVADGKISVKEAEELLSALGLDQSGESKKTSATGIQPRKNLNYLRVEVKSSDGDNVDVKVPISLLRAGIKLSSVMPNDVSEKITVHLAEHGMNLDLNNVKSEDIDQIIESLGEMEINVDSKDGDTVKIYCE
jgi:hypothetical protein